MELQHCWRRSDVVVSSQMACLSCDVENAHRKDDESWLVQVGAHILMKLDPDSTIADCHAVSQQVYDEKFAKGKEVQRDEQ
jgi:hypothetical protein